MSQPAVTQALSKLEQHLGFPLLERRANGSYLTPVGRILHLRVQRMIGQMEDAVLAIGGAMQREAASIMVHRLSRSHVRALIAIIEHSSLPQAALALDLTEASLQRSARELEANLRRPIFYRSAGGMMVRPEGVAFGRRLRLATQEIEWGLSEIEAVLGGHQGQMVIGALPFGGVLLLANVLDRFMSRHPTADVRVVSDSAAEMIKRLRAGDVDLLLGIVQGVSGDDLRNERFAGTPFRIVARRGHPLAKKRRIALADLARYEWIVGTIGSTRRACFDALFAGVDAPRSSLATSSLTIIRTLLNCSDRLTIITSFELASERGNLAALPYVLRGETPSIGVTMRADWLPTRLHDAFLEDIERGIQTARFGGLNAQTAK